MQKSKIPFSKCAGIFITARRSQINYCRATFESARGIDSKKLVLSEQYIQVSAFEGLFNYQECWILYEYYSWFVFRCFPRKCAFLFKDFVDSGVESDL